MDFFIRNYSGAFPWFGAFEDGNGNVLFSDSGGNTWRTYRRDDENSATLLQVQLKTVNGRQRYELGFFEWGADANWNDINEANYYSLAASFKDDADDFSNIMLSRVGATDASYLPPPAPATVPYSLRSVGGWRTSATTGGSILSIEFRQVCTDPYSSCGYGEPGCLVPADIWGTCGGSCNQMTYEGAEVCGSQGGAYSLDGCFIKDCAGTCYNPRSWEDGCDPSSKDDCGQCCGGNALKDCAGTCNGGAVVDCNGICNGGAVVDCEGICGGGAVVDCAGTCNGSAVYDDCGVCDGGNAAKDCAGICFGPYTYDDCGVCAGDNAAKDCAGYCYGGSNPSPLGFCCEGSGVDQNGCCTYEGDFNYGDCNGVCGNYGRTSQLDALGVCGGTCNDSTACGEDTNGCLYDHGCGCGVTCPPPSGSGDDSLIYRLVGLPWFVRPNATPDLASLIGLPPFIKL